MMLLRLLFENVGDESRHGWISSAGVR
jgi:hypothetical protein